MASFTTRSEVPRSPEQTFQYILDLSQWPLFRGSGPVPGIVEATLPEGGPIQLGSRVRVRNTDGSVHHEVVTAFEPARRYAVRMELTPPASYVLDSIVEEVELEPSPVGTMLQRRFELRPRYWFTAPLAWIMAHVFLKRAVHAHNAAAAAATGTRA